MPFQSGPSLAGSARTAPQPSLARCSIVCREWSCTSQGCPGILPASVSWSPPLLPSPSRSCNKLL